MWAYAATGRADHSRAAAIDQDIAEQFALMGVTVIPEDDPAEPEALNILPANHASFAVWLECQTQWNIVSIANGLLWRGLSYRDVREVLDDMEAPRHVFADIRVMERAALPVLNEVH